MQIMNQDLSEVQDRLPEGLISPTYERHEGRAIAHDAVSGSGSRVRRVHGPPSLHL
jgi:hypothetical protein